MKKLTIIPENNTPKIGDICKDVVTNKVFIATTQLLDDYYYKEVNRPKKVQLYIVDTENNANINDYSIDEDRLWQVNKPWGILDELPKVICTSNPSLPIPQISKQAIEYIVENNGELGEFDITFSSIDCEGKISPKQYKGYSFDKYPKVANIIPKSSKRTKEEHKMKEKINKYIKDHRSVLITIISYVIPISLFIIGCAIGHWLIYY